MSIISNSQNMIHINISPFTVFFYGFQGSGNVGGRHVVEEELQGMNQPSAPPLQYVLLGKNEKPKKKY